MAHRSVSADHGFRWLIESARLLAANPAPFLAMGATVALLAMLPLLGGLLLFVFGPALNAGIVTAAKSQAAGRPARYEHLFAGFTTPGKLPRLVALCLPWIAMLIALFMVLILLGVALAVFGVGGGDIESWASDGPPGPVLAIMLLLLLVGMLVPYALTFFAMPRVMLTDTAPLAAMRDSIEACITNIGAFIVFLLTLFAVAIAFAPLLALLPLRLGELLLMAFTVPWVAGALWLAYRDVFRDDITQELPPAPPSITA